MIYMRLEELIRHINKLKKEGKKIGDLYEIGRIDTAYK